MPTVQREFIHRAVRPHSPPCRFWPIKAVLLLVGMLSFCSFFSFSSTVLFDAGFNSKSALLFIGQLYHGAGLLETISQTMCSGAAAIPVPGPLCYVICSCSCKVGASHSQWVITWPYHITVTQQKFRELKQTCWKSAKFHVLEAHFFFRNMMSPSLLRIEIFEYFHRLVHQTEYNALLLFLSWQQVNGMILFSSCNIALYGAWESYLSSKIYGVQNQIISNQQNKHFKMG
jgi:hypothetical protein